MTQLFQQNCFQPLYALLSTFPVAISEGSHPFPSRTRKLSPPEPMVLRGKPRGRVGRCRIFFEAPVALRGGGFAVSGAACARETLRMPEEGRRSIRGRGDPSHHQVIHRCLPGGGEQKAW